MKKFMSVLRHLRRNWPAIKKIIEMILRLLPFLLSPKMDHFRGPQAENDTENNEEQVPKDSNAPNPPEGV